VRADARRDDGPAAEAIAARHLSERGLAIVERNARSRYGEIDVVARDGETLVFVEDRLRRSDRYGGAAASITRDKRRKLVAAAGRYLARLPRTPPCRFDVVLLDGLEAARVEWLRDVIEAADG
jgi:putative endonuclease